jgi:hypothetical protein
MHVVGCVVSGEVAACLVGQLQPMLSLLNIMPMPSLLYLQAV